MSINRNFKGVWIPKEIWESKDLTLQEKVFLTEIDSLDNENGCFASNDHFSEFFGLSKNRCTEIIKSLEKKGLVTISYLRDEGKMSIKKRIIRVLDKPNRGIRKTEQPIRNIEQGYSEKCEGNNTIINNTINNTDIPSSISKVQEIYNHYLSKNIVKHGKITSAMRTAINARLKDYSKEQIIQVIDNYAIVYHSDDYWFTTKYTLTDLMRDKDVRKFIDDAEPLKNFSNSKGVKTSAVDKSSNQSSYKQDYSKYDFTKKGNVSWLPEDLRD